MSTNNDDVGAIYGTGVGAIINNDTNDTNDNNDTNNNNDTNDNNEDIIQHVNQISINQLVSAVQNASEALLPDQNEIEDSESEYSYESDVDNDDDGANNQGVLQFPSTFNLPPITQADIDEVVEQERLQRKANDEEARKNRKQLEIDADNLQQSLVCPICADPFYKPVTLICQHTFCKSCLMSSTDRRCGICRLRYVIPKEHNRIIENAIKVFFREDWQQRDDEQTLEKAKQDLRQTALQQLRAELFEEAVNNSLEEFEQQVPRRTHAGSAEESPAQQAQQIPSTGNPAFDQTFGDSTNAIDGLLNGHPATIKPLVGNFLFGTCILLTSLFILYTPSLMFNNAFEGTITATGRVIHLAAIFLYVCLYRISSFVWNRENQRRISELPPEVIGRMTRAAVNLMTNGVHTQQIPPPPPGATHSILQIPPGARIQHGPNGPILVSPITH